MAKSEKRPFQTGHSRKFSTSRAGSARPENTRRADPPPDTLRRLVALFQAQRHTDLLRDSTAVRLRYPRSLALLSLMAGAHTGLGEFNAALACLDEALELAPENAEMHYNKGVILKKAGHPDAAIRSYETALRHEPRHAGAANNLGTLRKDSGDLQGAVQAYRKAIGLKPDTPAAHNNLGALYQQLGRPGDALQSYLSAHRLAPGDGDIRRNIGRLLTGHSLPDPVEGLAPLLIELLSDDDGPRPADIAPVVCRVVLNDPASAQARAQIDQDLPGALDVLSRIPLLLRIMTLCPLPDLTLEEMLVRLRAALLLALWRVPLNKKCAEVQSALAGQCFINEYLYPITAEESRAYIRVKAETEAKIDAGVQPDPHAILCLASYAPLSSLKFFDRLDPDSLPEDLCRMQVTETKKERVIRAALPTLGKVADAVSSAVQTQYEDNPYPRWIRADHGHPSITLTQLTDHLGLRLSHPAIRNISSPSILIAGCGTGQQSIETALRFSNCRITAIDLSRASLAYASRKTAELQLSNIDYIEADILDLDLLDRKFDLVISTGVLHHMADPVAGWASLCRRLKPNGLMKIALYSERARQDIVHLRDRIAKEGVGTDAAAMRSFRAALLQDRDALGVGITGANDFYSLSAVRDLLFHVQEHRFTIPQIAHALTQLGLAFCGFEPTDPRMMSRFRTRHPAPEAACDLGLWHAFEEDHPSTFSGMYQFWCQRT